MNFSSRPYQGQPDSERLIELLVQTRKQIGVGCWHTGDLVWRFFLVSLRHELKDTVRVWEQDGSPVAFGIFDPKPSFCAFDMQVQPQVRGTGIENEILDWIEDRWHQTTQDRGVDAEAPLLSSPGVYESDSAQLDALAERGFSRTEEVGLLYVQDLDAALPIPKLPEGFVVRPLSGENEAPARAAVHRDAFHPSRVADPAYARLMQTPGYERNLDFVAVAPDGAFAAFALGWMDETNRVTEFEPVGTRMAYRRMGLARAVLQQDMHHMRERGATSATVGPIDVADTQASALYQAVGFRGNEKSFAFEKRNGK